MKKPSKDQESEEFQNAVISDPDAAKLRDLAMLVIAEGFVPVEDVVTRFGDTTATKARAILYKNMRVLVEQRQAWNGDEKVGYRWADRRFSKADLAKIPPGYGWIMEVGGQVRVRYTDYQPITLRCRWTAPCLAGKPESEEEGATNRFERDLTNAVLIPRYCVRAMLMSALPLLNRQPNLAYHARASAVLIPNATVKETVHAVVDRQGKGRGHRRSEMLAAGTEFSLEVMVPISEISPAEYVKLIRVAGRHVGLSPGRSAGYGDFDVLGEA